MVRLALALLSLAGASFAEKPNLVLILADDLGWGDASSYGATRIKTPHIDRLAAEGRRFTDAHSPSSVCTPSRYNLITGRYAWRSWAGSSGVWANDPLIFDPETRLTLPALLKQAGYRTAMVGKWHLGFGRPGEPNFDPLTGIDWNGPIRPGPLESGFDSFFGIPHVGQLPHVYIRDHRVVGADTLDEPIRLALDPKRPAWHVPHDERPRDVGESPWLSFENTGPISYQHEELAVRLTEEAVASLEGRAPADEQPFFLYFAHRNPHVPIRPHPRFKGSSEIGPYGDFLAEFDWSVGEILRTLDERGLAEDTLVLLSSDNGGIARYGPLDRAVIEGHALNGPWRGQKTQLYEGGHRVPFLARWPGRIKPGTTSDALIALTDLVATCAELTGRTLPDEAAEDSFSFLPYLLDQPPAGPLRDALVVDSFRGILGLREGPWKYLPIQSGGGIREDLESVDPDLPPGQLYHLGLDPGETQNLWEDNPHVVERLADRLETIRTAGRSRPVLPQPGR